MPRKNKPQSAESKRIKAINQQMKEIAQKYDDSTDFYSSKFFTALTSELPRLAEQLKVKKATSGATYYALPNTKEMRAVIDIIDQSLNTIKRTATAGAIRERAKRQAKAENRTIKEQIDRNKIFNRISEIRQQRYDSDAKSAYFNSKYKNKNYAQMGNAELKKLADDLDNEQLNTLPQGVTANSTTDEITSAFQKSWKKRE